MEKFREIVSTLWQKARLPDFPATLLQTILDSSWPDFRRSYQTMEYMQAHLALEPAEQNRILHNYLEENRQLPADFTGYQYELMSALIKSLRGSDQNAALLYLAQMLEIGVDPTVIARRLVVLASEDIGLADTKALLLAAEGLSVIEKIGMPEAQITLAHVAVYLALAPKSNSTYKAIARAREFVRANPVTVPGHLNNQSPDIKKYCYPHDQGGYCRQNYWPGAVTPRPFYQQPATVFEFSEETILNRRMQNSQKNSASGERGQPG